MRIYESAKRFIALAMAVALCGLQVLPVQAGMVSTETLLQQEQGRLERQQLMQLLDRDGVHQQLIALGVAPGDARERVAQMSDSEVRQLNGRLAELPAGSGVLEIAFLIFLVFIVTDVIGATDIFPFVHPVK